MTGPRIRVLLVDDHAVVRNGVRLMLGTAPDIDVTGEAPTARDALSLVRKQALDVAGVDIAVPGRTGLEQHPYPQRPYLEQVRTPASAIQLTEQERAGRNGPAIAAALRAKRLVAIKSLSQSAPA